MFEVAVQQTSNAMSSILTPAKITIRGGTGQDSTDLFSRQLNVPGHGSCQCWATGGVPFVPLPLDKVTEKQETNGKNIITTCWSDLRGVNTKSQSTVCTHWTRGLLTVKGTCWRGN